MAPPLVALASLGGTITMTADSQAGSGVVPRLRADDLVDAVPALAGVARLRAETLLSRPGASLTTVDLVEVARWARAQAEHGVDGVVVVQGTDTIEETAWLLDLWWDAEAPVVVTGAMRPPAAPGAEGPDNLLTAVRAAASPAARGAGCLVAMDGVLHAGSRVRKTHATALDAFTSPDTGPAGRVHEGEVWLRPRRRAPALPVPQGGRPVRVALLETHLDDDGDLLRRVADAGYDAVVLAAYGAGHVSEACAEAVTDASERLPVVVASRTGAGATLRQTYGFGGSERDLRDRGAILSGWLDARRARALTWSLLSSGASREDLAEQVRRRGGVPE